MRTAAFAPAAVAAAMAERRRHHETTMGRRVIRRYRMNPCDCVFHALDHLMRTRGYAGAGTFMILEAEGPLTPAAVRRALQQAMQAHPSTMSAAAVSRWLALPSWILDGTPVPPHYTFDDLSGQADWPRAADELCQARLSRGWDVAQPPPVRLEHYAGPSQRHRICLRWAHAFMDAEGAQQFLSEMNRFGSAPPPDPAEGLLSDMLSVDPLAGLNPLRRLGLMLRGLRERAPHARVRDAALCLTLPDRPADSRRLRYLVRAWSADAIAEMRDHARRVAPPGPALYGRYLAGCTLRAVYRVHAEHGRRLARYDVLFPLRTPGLARRPVRGNYLVAASLRVQADRIDDRRAVAEDIACQLAQYMERGSGLAGAALQRLTARLRVSHYRRLIRWQTENQPFLTGFSFYGEIEPPLRRFLGAEVTNLYGGGVISIPPGWNVTFSRFGDRMNLVVAWPDGAFPTHVVERYADLIEQEVFDR